MKSKRHKKTWQNVCFAFMASLHTDLQVTNPSMWRKLLPHSRRTKGRTGQLPYRNGEAAETTPQPPCCTS